jgi:hypothetical protein
MKLVQTNTLDPDTQFMCLSHCWGSLRPDCITVKDTYARNTEEITWKGAPKTLRDAVRMTRRFKIQYIWIDSLCIVQDDEQDWRDESVRMATIYDNAYLTLAATGSSDGSGGLFHEQKAPYKWKRVTYTDRKGVTTHVYARQAFNHLQHLSAESLLQTNKGTEFPLMRRAWVFQERRLSPRVLHFTQNEAMWECREGLACECSTGRNTIKQKYFFRLFEHRSALDHSNTRGYKAEKYLLTDKEWYRGIAEFSEMALTKGTDRLPAISGMAKQTKRWHDGDTYLAGLWKGALIKDLLWSTSSKPSGRNPRPAEWQGPSWSWASIDDAVKHDVRTDRKSVIKHTTKIVSVSTSPVGTDPTGEVNNGTIEIEEPAVMMRLVYTNSSDKRYSFISVKDKERKWNHVFCPDYDFKAPGGHRIEDGATVHCIRLIGYFRLSPYDSDPRTSYLV